MMNPFLSKLHRFQERLVEIGLAQAVLALPAPRMQTLAAPSADSQSAVFSKTVSEPEIESVSRDLFASGHYSLAVQEAFKAVERYIQHKSGEYTMSGSRLMQHVFSSERPVLQWSERRRTSEADEHKGYQMLYSGAMVGIRNPVVHEFGWVDDAETALELLVFAQHLIRKAKQTSLIDSNQND